MSNFSEPTTDSTRRVDLESALLSGVPVGAGQLAHCDVCGACLRPNHRVEVLVLITGTHIDLPTLRCGSCARGAIRPETERSCLLATGRLAGEVGSDGHSRVILSGARVVDRTD